MNLLTDTTDAVTGGADSAIGSAPGGALLRRVAGPVLVGVAPARPVVEPVEIFQFVD